MILERFFAFRLRKLFVGFWFHPDRQINQMIHVCLGCFEGPKDFHETMRR